MLRKRAGIPEVDADARPSSYALRMTDCMNKRKSKLYTLLDSYDELRKAGEVGKPGQLPEKLQKTLSCDCFIYGLLDCMRLCYTASD